MKCTLPLSVPPRYGKFLGKASFVGSVAIDRIGVYNYYRNGEGSPNSVHSAQFGLDTTMGYIGSKWNPVAGLVYAGVDIFYLGGKEHPEGGWKQWAVDYDKIQKQNAVIVPGFITAPYCALKQ